MPTVPVSVECDTRHIGVMYRFDISGATVLLSSTHARNQSKVRRTAARVSREPRHTADRINGPDHRRR